MMRKEIRNAFGGLLVLGIVVSFLQCKQSTDHAAAGNAQAGTLDSYEQHRPRYHFTPPEKWMNDPNGMVYYQGEYHLFYQHYPDDIVWGPMHWGHAVSEDLVNWEHLPIALYPDSLGYIFSGSAVIDWNNTSGLGTESQPPMIAIFTHHNPVEERSGVITYQDQSIAYSLDNGRTWAKYPGNPVIENPGIRDFRDPKVIWDQENEQWVMVFAAWDHVKFYTSQNLLDWDHASDFGREWGTHAGVWECPDLFQLEEQTTGGHKWVLLVSINPGGPNGGSGTQYFLGDFDGKVFSLDASFARRLGREKEIVPDGYVFEDFEDTRYSKWDQEGFAFGNYPASGSMMNQGKVEGYMGNKLANSFFNGDETQGSLTSPTFEIKNRYINFLIGGGMHAGRAGMDLIVDGEVVRTATGSQRDILSWKVWDVSAYTGKFGKLKIYDQVSGGWGHILVDQIIFSDEPASPALEKAVFLDYGRDNYAGVTWSDIPSDDGRRIFMGWMSNWSYANVVPTDTWRSAMTLPRELVLDRYEGKSFVMSRPVQELMQLRHSESRIAATVLDQEGTLTIPIENGIAEVILEMTLEQDTGALQITFSNPAREEFQIGLDLGQETWYTDRRNAGSSAFSAAFAVTRHRAPVIKSGKVHSVHLFLDVASVEVFANNGMTVFTDIFFPTVPMTQMHIRSNNGQVTVEGVRYSLKSANFEFSPM